MKLTKLLCIMLSIMLFTAVSSYAENISIIENVDKSDYSVQVDLKIDNGAENVTALLLVRTKHTELYGDFYYGVGILGDNFVVQKKSAKGYETLAYQNMKGTNDGTYHKITAKAVDNCIEAYWDDNHIITVYDGDIMSGVTGLLSQNTGVEFGAVSVTEISDMQGDYDNEWGGDFNSDIDCGLKVKNINFYDSDSNKIENGMRVYPSAEINLVCDLGDYNLNKKSQIIGAVYTDDNVLSGAFTQNVVFENGTANITRSFIIPETKKYCKVNLYTWNEKGNMVPLCRQFKVGEFNTVDYNVDYNDNIHYNGISEPEDGQIFNDYEKFNNSVQD